MTDMLHYQDVYPTINIPKTEYDIRLQTASLRSIASNPKNLVEGFDITSRFSRVVNTTETSQVFWEIKPTDGRAQRLLALTACNRGGLAISIDRRPTHEQPDAFRKSLHDFSIVFDSNPQSDAFNGSSSELEVQQFYDEFYSTIAAIALHQRCVAAFETQNESSAAIFASVA